jgi:SnoaL-like domain
MSQENLERIRAILPPDGSDLVEVFGPAGQLGSGDTFSDDATVQMTSRSAVAEGEGPEGFRAIWADWLEPWQSYRMYYEGLEDRGEQIVVRVRMRGVTKHGGVEMEHEGAALFRFEGDQVVDLDFQLEPDKLGD